VDSKLVTLYCKPIFVSFRFQKRWGLCWLAEWLLAFH
jgi:hypothetical protein